MSKYDLSAETVNVWKNFIGIIKVETDTENSRQLVTFFEIVLIHFHFATGNKCEMNSKR